MRSRHGGCALKQGALSIITERKDPLDAVLKSQLADPAEIRRATHHHCGCGIFEEVTNLAALVGGVEREKHMACP